MVKLQRNGTHPLKNHQKLAAEWKPHDRNGDKVLGVQ